MLGLKKHSEENTVSYTLFFTLYFTNYSVEYFIYTFIKGNQCYNLFTKTLKLPFSYILIIIAWHYNSEYRFRVLP